MADDFLPGVDLTNVGTPQQQGQHAQETGQQVEQDLLPGVDLGQVGTTVGAPEAQVNIAQPNLPRPVQQAIQSGDRRAYEQVLAGMEPEQRGQVEAQALDPATRGVEAFTHGFANVAGDLPYRFDAAAHATWARFTGGDFGKTYDDRLREDKAYVDTLWNEYPKTSIGGNILGLVIGSIVTAPAAPAALASTTMGRIAWQGVIGAGQNAWLGYAHGQGGVTSSDRFKQAVQGAPIGFGLGLAGGAVGEGITAGSNRLFGKPISAEAKQAMEQTGIKPGVPAAQQPHNITGAVEHLSPQDPASLNLQSQSAEAGLTKAAKVAKEQGNAAVDLLHHSISLGAQTSSDAVGSVAQDVARMASEGPNGINLRYLNAGSNAKQAIGHLETLQEFAAKAPNGKIPLKELFDAHKAINGLVDDGDHIVPAINGAFAKWLNNIQDASLFDNGRQAINEWNQFRAGYGQYKQLVNPASSLGNVLSRQLNANHISNWISNISGTNAAEKGVEFAQGVKSLLGADSPEWSAVRNFSVAKLMNLAPRQLAPETMNPNVLADGVAKLLKAPASRELLTPAEYGYFQAAETALRNIPAKEPLIHHLVSGLRELAIGTGAAGAGAAYSGIESGGDPWEIVTGALKGAAISMAATKAGVPVLRGAMRTAPSIVGPGMAPVGGELWRSVQPRSRGGAAKRALSLAHALASNRR